MKLHDFENRMLQRMHRENPEFADDFERDYLEERRKAALRVFDTRGNLEKIVELLAARAHG